MVPEIAAAAEKLEPGVAAAAAAAFEASSWGARPAAAPAQEAELEREMLAAAASAPVALVGSAADGSKQGAGSEKDDVGTAAEAGAAAEQGSAQPELQVVRPSAALEARPRSAVRRALERAGLGGPQLLPALHMAVLTAVCGVLVVCRAAYVGLGERSLWVAITGACVRRPEAGGAGGNAPASCCRAVPCLFTSGQVSTCPKRLPPCLLPAKTTVVASFEQSEGRILYRCINRLLGTLAGVAYSCLVIALCLAVTGGSYADTAAK